MRESQRRARARSVAIAALGTAVALATANTTMAAPEEPSTTVAVDWSAERQHVDGFGGSFAFHKAGTIQRLGERSPTRFWT